MPIGNCSGAADIVDINASQEFEKGRPENSIPDARIPKIARAFHQSKVVDKFAHIIDPAEAEQHRDVQCTIDDLASVEARAESLDGELSQNSKSSGYQPYA